MRDTNLFNLKRALPRMVSEVRLAGPQVVNLTSVVFAELESEEPL